MFTLTIATTKGGVGKSTTAANLAAAWREVGKKVLLVDLDSGFTLTKMLGQSPVSGRTSFDLLVKNDSTVDELVVPTTCGVDLIPGYRDLDGLDLSLASVSHREFRLAAKLRSVDYDVVIIDTPPAGGLSTSNALVASDYSLALLSGEDAFALQGIRNLEVKLAELADGPVQPAELIGVLFTFVDARLDIYNSLKDNREVRELPLLTTEIPKAVEIAKAGIQGVPLISKRPDSVSGSRYRKVREELDAIINEKENS